jgi:hypothetical protein
VSGAGAFVRDAVIVSCAVSAGIHGALIREHLAEGTGAGAGFAASTAVLAVLVVALTRSPESRVAVLAAALVLAGLLGAYALAITTGVPLLHPDREPLDGLAFATKAVEAGGLVAAIRLLRGLRRPFALTVSHPKGTLT